MVEVRHAIETWRDEWTLVAAIRLNKAATELVGYSDATIAAATSREVLLGANRLLTKRVTPAIQAATERVVHILVADSDTALRRIVQHASAGLPHVEVASTPLADRWAEVAEVVRAVGPAAGRIVAATGALIGFSQLGRLQPHFEAQLRARARAQVMATLFEGTAKAPSVLKQMTDALAAAAEQAKGMLR